MSRKPAILQISDHLVKIAVIFVGCALTQLNSSADIGIVAPNNLANIEGNSQTITPFGNPAPIRSQEVFDASQFSAVSQGGGWINSILFRVDGASTLGATASATNLQINLSTTGKAPDSLSPVFAQNVGANDAVVFGPGPINLFGPHFNNASPQPFEIQITFSAPFFYDPSKGNLLMDVRNYTGGQGFGNFDGVLTTGDSVSRVVGQMNSDSAFLTDSFGYVTLFGVTPVPEPSSVALFVGGCAVFGCAICRRRKKDQIRLVSFAENNKRTEAGCDKICENEL